MLSRILLVSLFCIIQVSYAFDFIETPILLADVKSGKLPPIQQRIPQTPKLVEFDDDFSAGKHGGELRLLMGKQKDIRQMVIYGYARLVGYNAELQLVADILEDVEVVEGRIFTLHIRQGHRWSDGHLFTSEDFR